MNEQNVLFYEYEDIKPILSVGQYALVKYQKQEKEKKRGITNRRQSAMKEIVDEMKKDGEVDVKLLVMKLSHVDTDDLYFMLKTGLQYKAKKNEPFSKYIWGSVKPKKI